ncbi:hypothetical protein ACFY4C_40215 [Actinomadura viridis]|uniref:hypothetical protein n=1 Tax=Actinomadura viridis TaxID=58110 RepID=UPI0036CDDE21
MSPAVIRPAELAEIAVTGFAEAMRTYSQPTFVIRRVSRAAREATERSLMYVPARPTPVAFDMAVHEVSWTVRLLLEVNGQRPAMISAIRDEAHRLARKVDAGADAGGSAFVREAHKFLRQNE